MPRVEAQHAAILSEAELHGVSNRDAQISDSCEAIVSIRVSLLGVRHQHDSYCLLIAFDLYLPTPQAKLLRHGVFSTQRSTGVVAQPTLLLHHFKVM